MTTETNCYVCEKRINDDLVTFPFCTKEHHEEWLKENSKQFKVANLSRFKEFLKDPKIMGK